MHFGIGLQNCSLIHLKVLCQTVFLTAVEAEIFTSTP